MIPLFYLWFTQCPISLGSGLYKYISVGVYQSLLVGYLNMLNSTFVLRLRGQLVCIITQVTREFLQLFDHFFNDRPYESSFPSSWLWFIQASPFPSCIFVNNSSANRKPIYSFLAADQSRLFFFLSLTVQVEIRHHPFTVIIKPPTLPALRGNRKKHSALNESLCLWVLTVSLQFKHLYFHKKKW